MHGRGDLHLGVLIEKMRREGFEMSVTPPQVILKEDPDTGEMLEPYEEVKIDTDLDYLSGIIDRMNERKGVLLDVQEQKDGRQLVTFRVPSRGLLGFRNLLTTDTKGTAQMT
jgi:GTP-binding protein